MVTLIILALLFNFIAFVAPKRRTKVELYTTALFACLLGALADGYFSQKYHFYWYFSREISWKWLIVIFGGYPAISVLFANYFPLRNRLLVKVGYVLGWSVILATFEWLLVYIGGALYYHTWKFWHSVALYPFLMGLLAANLYFVRYLLKEIMKE